MSYEMFRNDMLLGMTDILPMDQVNRVLALMDATAAAYDIGRKSTELTVLGGGVPQIVKLYIAAKSIENKSRNTLDNYLVCLKKFFNDTGLPFDKVTPNDIRAYLYRYKLQNKVSDSTLDKIRGNISTFYKWCVNEEYLQRNPAAKVSPIKYQEAQVEPLAPLDLEIVRSVCADEREKAIVDLLYCSGIRVSELCDLLKTDVDINELTIHIRHGKGDKARTTYLNAEAAISLRNYLKKRFDNCPYLIVSERKPIHKMKREGIEKILKRIGHRTGMDLHLHPHKFRHTMATDALERGMNIEQVQKILGHANISTTMRYAKVKQTDVKNAHKKYMA